MLKAVKIVAALHNYGVYPIAASRVSSYSSNHTQLYKKQPPAPLRYPCSEEELGSRFGDIPICSFDLQSYEGKC